MDIVDSQIHLGPGHIEETLAAMDALGIKSALIDEFWLGTALMPSYTILDGSLRRATYPTSELASLTHPDRFSYLARVDRRDPEMRSIIRLLGDRPQARALRIAPGLSRTEVSALAEGGYDDLFSAALQSGLTVIFVAIPGNAPALKPSLEKYPDLKFVIDHCGMPTPAASRQKYAELAGSDLPPMGDTSDERGKAVEFDKVLRLAAEHANVGLKWAHAQRMFGVSGYPFVGLRSYLKKALTSFGAERVMWASDASANQTGETWAELLFWLIDNPDLSTSERTQLLGGTARRWLNWPAN